MRAFRRILTIVIPIVLLVSVGGTFATWSFAGVQSPSLDTTFDFGVGRYVWDGSEILPDDVEGENHVQLVNDILNATDSNGNPIGLNYPDSALNQNVDNRLNGGALGWLGIGRAQDYYGSMDGTIIDNSINMEDIFKTETNGLAFIIQVKDELNYYAFTCDVDLGSSGAPNVAIGRTIYPVYRTLLVRSAADAVFVAQSTEIGYATSQYYKQLTGISGDQRAPSFDVDTWSSANPMGTSAQYAIWTFVGDDPVARAENEGDTVYYQIAPAAGSRYVATGNPKGRITVKDASGNVLATSAPTTVDGVDQMRVTFTATANTTYLIEVTGDLTVPLLVG